jgi:hypothetical protein
LEEKMAISDRHPDDPAVGRFGPKPTDRSLPLERRTHPGPYLVALIVVLLIGMALVAFGGLRLTQTTSQIQSRPDAASPAENLVPGQDGYTQSGTENTFDRDAQPSPGNDTDTGTPVPNAP